MTKYYNANQVHKYGYRPQFVMPSKEESVRIAQEAVERLEKIMRENEKKYNA